jgi:hypothetical protein
MGVPKYTNTLEKRLREDEALATAITMLRESLTKNRNPILI